MKRIFIKSESATDDMRAFCGGPDIEEVMKGLHNYLRLEVEMLLSGQTTGHVEIELNAIEMTDEEVDAILEM